MAQITGSEIRALRKKLGLNQKDFWAPLGVTQSGGSRYENDMERSIPAPTQKLFFLLHHCKIGTRLTRAEQAKFDNIGSA